MNCPACQTPMVEEDFGGVAVDVCKNGCKGIWFDWIELEKLDETQEGLGNALNEALNSERHKDDDRGQINCPKCDRPMIAHLYKAAKEVTVDECYICGGFFLDSGELEVIRDNFMSEADREVYVANLLKSTIPEFGDAKKDLEKEKQRIEALKKMTKILRPSSWGKKE